MGEGKGRGEGGRVVARRAQWVVTLVPVYAHESRVKGIQVRGEAEPLC